VTGSWLPFLPHLVLLAAGLTMLVAARLLNVRKLAGPVSLTAVLAAGIAASITSTTENSRQRETSLSGERTHRHAAASRRQGMDSSPMPTARSPWVWTLNLAFLTAGGLLCLAVWHPLRENRFPGESFGLMLLGLSGAMLTGTADDIRLLFVGLELSAISGVGLIASSATQPRALGLPRKSLAIQAVSAAVLLIALAMISGQTGATDLPAMRAAFAADDVGVEFAGPGSRWFRTAFVLLFAALAVRLFVVPFHFGASETLAHSSPAARCFGLTVPRFAAFMVLFRVGYLTTPAFGQDAVVVSAVLAGGTMLIPTALALGRTNLRETFTDLMIGQGGAVLFGLSIAWGHAANSAGPPALPERLTQGISAAALMMVSVVLSQIGIVAVFNHLCGKNRPVEFADELKGLFRSRPRAAVILVVLLLNLVGVPPLPGFWARLLTWFSALSITTQSVESGLRGHSAYVVLCLVMGIQVLLTAAVTLRLVAVMVFEPLLSPPRSAGSKPAFLSAALCAGLLVGLGLSPTRVIERLNQVLPEIDTARSGQTSANRASKTVQRDGSPASPGRRLGIATGSR